MSWVGMAHVMLTYLIWNLHHRKDFNFLPDSETISFLLHMNMPCSEIRLQELCLFKGNQYPDMIYLAVFDPKAQFNVLKVCQHALCCGASLILYLRR